MRQSNGYIILFTVVLTVVCAGVLAGVFEGLKGQINEQEALDKKKQILSAVIDINGMKGKELDAKYTASIEAISVNSKGEILPDINAEDVNVMKMFKQKDVSLKVFPVFIYKNGDQKSYILPMYGNGLWDAVWAFVALDGDLNTIKGVSFGHKGETPGLGARITDKSIRDRFIGKQIFNADGTFGGVTFQKGEKIDYTDQSHKVDGLAGASMTTNGVNNMLNAYFQSYEPYFINTLAASAVKVKEPVKVDVTPVADSLSEVDSTPISDTLIQE